VLAGLELADQLRTAGVAAPVTVILPSATGGTQAGVLTGLRVAGWPQARARVLGIAVASPSAELRPTIEKLLAGLAPLAGATVDQAEIELSDPERGPGYGIPTAAATAATELLARTEGILVDPIYTAKALAGLIDRCRDGRLKGSVVFWHAGGTPGLFETL
jgi:1-aminocyclopropane-1-carboxylate deaminase/D-cysteine desulfhydrase-like pyridoxal-dependent ACC family enzyme